MRWCRAGVAATLAAGCGAAGAHSAIPGAGAFYSGVYHAAVVPSHVVALLAFGLLLGQGGLQRHIQALIACSGALLLGGAAARLGLAMELEVPVLLLAAATALWVVLDRALPAAAWFGIAVAIGSGIGLGSTLEGLAPGGQWLALAGTWLGSTAGVALVANLADAAQRPWQRIALRVVASWLAAAALLVLALALLGPAPRAQAAKQSSMPASSTGPPSSTLTWFE
jgi:urease accessory protein